MAHTTAMRIRPAFVALLVLSAVAARAQDDEPPSPRAEAPPQLSASSSDAPHRPQGKTLGVGVAIGAPVGLAGKLFIADSAAVSLLLGFWGTHYAGGALDFEYHPVPALGVGEYGAPFLVVGVGVGVGAGDASGRGFLGGRTMYSTLVFDRGPYTVDTPGDVGLDVHGKVGLGWAFRAAPVDLFAEFTPGLLLLPDLNVGSRFTIGGRWWL